MLEYQEPQAARSATTTCGGLHILVPMADIHNMYFILCRDFPVALVILERMEYPGHRADLVKMAKMGNKEIQESPALLEYQGNQEKMDLQDQLDLT